MAISTAAIGPIARHHPIRWRRVTGPPRRVAVAVAAARKAIEGVSDELNAVAAENLDFAPARRRVRAAFADVQRRLDHFLFKMAPTGIQMEERYKTNSKGMEIFWKSWLPKPGTTTKAALFFCHGYGDTCTFFFEGIAKRIADAGYAVFAMDYPGFGLSQGLHGYIPSFDGMVDQVIERYAAIRGTKEVRGLQHFLLGQSMGGAVALKVHLKQPEVWGGVLLVAPMCKAEFNVISYADQMRLRTAVELTKATRDIESQLEKVCAPLLILHGAADKVTDPNVSKFLYAKASTKDKTLKLYAEGYHSILEGEPDERISSVINDIISWLDSHTETY
nr:PREDICTED: caffeoylshikimate esterase isoform X2 [Musa acuminata subsp. malaccensis]